MDGCRAVCLDGASVVMAERHDPSLPELFRKCADGLYRFILVRVGGDRHDAEDLLQQTCAIAIQNQGNPRISIANEAWLFGIARNLVRRYWRDTRKELLSQGFGESQGFPHLLQALDEGPLPDELATARETSQALLLAVTALPTSDQQLVFSYYFDGRSQLEVAAEQGISPKTVEMRLYRIRARLREILGGGEERKPS